MKGHFPDQFLEGWVGAIPPGYSAVGRVTADSTRTGDRLQPTLLRRFGFRPQVKPSVIAPRKLGVSYKVKVPVG